MEIDLTHATRWNLQWWLIWLTDELLSAPWRIGDVHYIIDDRQPWMTDSWRGNGVTLLNTAGDVTMTSQWRRRERVSCSKEVTMESLFRCRQPSSVDSDGGPTVPGGIALQWLNRDASTSAGDDARPSRSSANSQRGLQPTSVCPAVHVVTEFCSNVTTTDSRGRYWFLRVVFRNTLLSVLVEFAKWVMK